MLKRVKLCRGECQLKFGILTLGCDKNTADSEYYAAELAKQGVQTVAVEAEPVAGDEMLNGVIINTCGFIESSKSQSVAAILDWARLKKTLIRKHRSFRLYVVGCLSQRYATELPKELPEVDGWLGVGDWRKIPQLLANESRHAELIDAHPQMAVCEGQNRIRLDEGKKFYAFLKIGDGCPHNCAFCAIPQIKGRTQISVPREQILREATDLLASGIKELCVVAQDTAAYGRDLYGRNYGLPDLLADLAALPVAGEWWIRLLYVYPAGITPKLLDVMASSPRIVPYIDMPLQHTHPEILAAMRRPDATIDIEAKIKKIRHALPDVTLRTTFILGFPGETAEQYRHLENALSALRFDRMGSFLYSAEENTDALLIKPRIAARIAQSRQNRLMAVQEKFSAESGLRLKTRTIPVLIEEQIEKNRWIGRGWRDAPEVDGVVIVEAFEPLKAGEFVQVLITGSDVHDLYGEVVLK